MIGYNRLETKIATIISFFINVFIIGTATIFSGQSDFVQLKEIGTTLTMYLGSSASIIFALGLFSSGQSSTIAGVLTGQYIMEGFLNVRINRRVRIIISRLINLLPCLLIALYMDIEWVYIILNIIQVVQLPFVLIPLFKFVENSDIVKGGAIDKPLLQKLKIISFVFLIMNMGQVITSIPNGSNFIVLFIILICVYFGVIWRLWHIKIYAKPELESNRESFEMMSVEC